MTERRYLGYVSVDSGTLLLGDPVHVLPSEHDGKPGLDYQEVLDADANTAAVAVAHNLALLVQNFGGDGDFGVFGEFEDKELLRIVVDFEPLGSGVDDS